MEKEFITKKSLANAKPYHTHNSSESKLFIRDEDILKFLKKEFLNRKSTVIRLEKLNNDHLIIPNKILYDRKSFLGYSAHFFNDYIQLEKILLDDTIPFEERKNICTQIYEIYIDMEAQNFAYYDIHPYNILYKNGDIKFCDLDSGAFRQEIYGPCDFFNTYNTYLRFGNYMISVLTLALLYKDHLTPIISKIKKNKPEIYSLLSSDLKEFYEYAITKKCSFLDVRPFIDKIDEDLINETKLIMKKN